MLKKIKTKRPFFGASVIVSLLMLAFAWAVYMIGQSLDTPMELTANVLREKTIKPGINIKKIKQLRSIIAQTPIPPELVNPAFFCNTTKEENPIYQGEFVDNAYKVAVKKGGEFEATFFVENKGTVPWFSDDSGCRGLQPIIRLGTARDRDRASIFYNSGHNTGWTAANRIIMKEDRVNPGEIASFYLNGKAPKVTDTYREYFQLVVEGVAWMERKEETVRLDVAVGYVDPRDEERLKYINKSAMASIIPDPAAPKEFHVDISDQKLHVKLGDMLVREYTVSTGTFKTPTPLGQFKILQKQDLRIGAKAPHYRMPQFQLITKSGVGFHALPYLASDKGVFWNEALNHIGQRVSHGCIRLLPDAAEDFFSLTALGDNVVIQN